MQTVSRHLIAEYYGCDTALLDDVAVIREHMLEAARIIGATVMQEAFHRYEPQGVSGTLVIAESHLSIHTWPESGYVAVDIFTCGGLDPRPGFRYLGKAMHAKRFRMQEIVRGLAKEIDEQRHLLPEDVHIITKMTCDEEMGAGSSTAAATTTSAATGASR